MTAILCIAALVAAVWLTVFLLRGSLIPGCLGYLLMTCCFGSWFWTFDVAGVTLSLDRLFFVALVGVWLVQWRLGKTVPKPMSFLDFSLLGLVFILTASALTHDWRAIPPQHPPVIQHLINGYFIPLTLYFIARQAPMTEKSITQVLAAGAVFGLYLAVTGVLEAAQMWSLIFPRYIADAQLGLHFGRARGPMLHSVSFGFYLAACLLAIWLWRDRLTGGWKKCVTLLAPLLLPALYLCKTRSVWMGAATGVIILLAATLRGRARIAMLGALLTAGLIVGLLKTDAILGLQREGTVQDTRRSASMRASFTYVSWKMFLDRPLFGFGFGQFATAKLPYLSDRSVDLHLESIRQYVHHNTFLSILTETGLVGLGFLLTVVIGWSWCAWSVWRNPKAAAWMCRQALLFLGVLGIAFWQMIGHDITYTTIDHSLIFFLAGVTVGIRQMLDAPIPLKPNRRGPMTADARTLCGRVND